MDSVNIELLEQLTSKQNCVLSLDKFLNNESNCIEISDDEGHIHSIPITLIEFLPLNKLTDVNEIRQQFNPNVELTDKNINSTFKANDEDVNDLLILNIISITSSSSNTTEEKIVLMYFHEQGNNNSISVGKQLFDLFCNLND